MITAKTAMKIKLLEKFNRPPCGMFGCEGGVCPSPKADISSPAADNSLVLLQLSAPNDEISPYAYTKYLSPSLKSYQQSPPPTPVETTTDFSEIPFQVFSTSNFTLYPYPVRLRSTPVTIPEKTAVASFNSSSGVPGIGQEQANAEGILTVENKEKIKSATNKKMVFEFFILVIIFYKLFIDWLENRLIF